jgi:hypothetical protein
MTPPPSPEALIQRLRYCANSACVDEPDLRDLIREAADALASSQEALRAAERARPQIERLLTLTEETDLTEAVDQVESDQKLWIRACEEIKRAEQWPPNAWPSMHDRAVFAALLERARAAERARDEEERAHLETIDQRDRAEDAADRLAYAIAPMEEIGEHSNLNDPWQNALDALGIQQATLQAKEQEIARLPTALEEAEKVIAYDLRPCPEPNCDHCQRTAESLPLIRAALASSGAETP